MLKKPGWLIVCVAENVRRPMGSEIDWIVPSCQLMTSVSPSARPGSANAPESVIGWPGSTEPMTAAVLVRPVMTGATLLTVSGADFAPEALLSSVTVAAMTKAPRLPL